MKSVTYKYNTFNRPYGVIFYGLTDIDWEVHDSLQLCDTLEEAEMVAIRPPYGVKTEVVKVEINHV